MKIDDAPLRILHVIGAMQHGGIQTWLMHMLRHIDRERFRMDFLVHTQEEQAHDREIRSLNSRVIPCPNPSNPAAYARNFRRVLELYGHYDVVHSHNHHFSGIPLLIGRQLGIAHRFAHSHNDKLDAYSHVNLPRRAYLTSMRASIQANSTLQLAISRRAARSLYGDDWASNDRVELLYYGIELAPFEHVRSPETVRAELGLPTDIPIIGHVGSFSEQKNHTFLLEIAAALARRGQPFHLLLVGDGRLRAQIEADIAQHKLQDHVTLLGLRSDVPELMASAMDLFLFPSLYEGLGLVLLEAQAAGTPCLFSDVVPEEADVVDPLMTRLPLAAPASAWADQAQAKLLAPASLPRTDALNMLQQSRFNLESAVARLENIYERELT